MKNGAGVVTEQYWIQIEELVSPHVPTFYLQFHIFSTARTEKGTLSWVATVQGTRNVGYFYVSIIVLNSFHPKRTTSGPSGGLVRIHLTPPPPPPQDGP